MLFEYVIIVKDIIHQNPILKEKHVLINFPLPYIQQGNIARKLRESAIILVLTSKKPSNDYDFFNTQPWHTNFSMTSRYAFLIVL